MARKQKMKTKSKLAKRYQDMSQDEIGERWYAQRGRYVKGLGFFIIAAVTLFLANHFQHFEQSILNIVNVAFQIFCVFSILFGMLTAMSFIYGKAPAAKSDD